MKRILTIENLHLFTGFTLIIAGILGYFADGVTTLLSWAIFGAMYISMSDIGEGNMTKEELASINHIIRTVAAYLGAILSTCLSVFYLLNL